MVSRLLQVQPQRHGIAVIKRIANRIDQVAQISESATSSRRRAESCWHATYLNKSENGHFYNICGIRVNCVRCNRSGASGRSMGRQLLGRQLQSAACSRRRYVPESLLAARKFIAVRVCDQLQAIARLPSARA
jgi:hypothetical protein